MNNEPQPEPHNEFKEGYKAGIRDATRANKLHLTLYFGKDDESEFRALLIETKLAFKATHSINEKSKFEVVFLDSERLFHFGVIFGSRNFKPLEDAPF